jgi:LysR family transcriptional regulator, regulator for bpeEF and oprC
MISVIGDALRRGDLVPVLPDWDLGHVPLHAVYPDNRLIAERVRAFVAFIARKSKSEPDLSGERSIPAS